MAYENGRRVNHYAKKIQHKQKQKKQKACFWGCTGMSYEQFCAIQEEKYLRELNEFGKRWTRYLTAYKKYWTPASDSGYHHVIKRVTNSRLRAQERTLNLLTEEDYENLTSPLNHSTYKQLF